MNNLTAREKGFMYVITLLIVVVLSYFFGIRTLNNKYEEYKVQLQEKQARIEYLDQLRQNNDSMRHEIDFLKEESKKLELSFIDKLETECIEQYVLDVFEEAGCPYLVSISSSEVGMAAVSYADGTASPDGVACLQIGVEYSSTDGYTVTQYNRNDDYTDGAEIPPETLIPELAKKMGSEEYSERVGYDEFLNALKKINKDNPNCIKVDSIVVEGNGGAMTLKATINFYGTNLQKRLSEDTNDAPYTAWHGHTNVDTTGGFIGFPYICDNENSLWFGVTNVDADLKSNQPFAAYWANALFKARLNEADGNIATVIGFEDKLKAHNEAKKAERDAKAAEEQAKQAAAADNAATAN